MKKLNYAIATATTLALFASATPALAFDWHGGSSGGSNSSDISVSNDNTANVYNGTISVAATGGNSAGGGNGAEGGNGGSGGDVNGNDGNAGEGGNGAAGGDGGAGTVITGDAMATAGTLNVVNTNATDIESDCGCANPSSGSSRRGHKNDSSSSRNSSDIKVDNDSDANVYNLTAAVALTGGNDAWGGSGADGGNGGSGGDVNNSGNNNDYRGHHKGGNSNDQESNAGDGGNGGAGGDGWDGGVQTGDAMSDAGTINIVNTNLTRIHKGSN